MDQTAGMSEETRDLGQIVEQPEVQKFRNLRIKQRILSLVLQSCLLRKKERGGPPIIFKTTNVLNA